MTRLKSLTLAAILPYAVWMMMLFTLPATAGQYALRSVLTAVLLIASLVCAARSFGSWGCFRPALAVRSLAWGLLVGVVVCVLWIFPERFVWYRDFSLLGLLGLGGGAAEGPSPYEPAVCGWDLTIIKLLGSAFVIAPVEEIFFRSFLYRWLQHNDWTSVPLKRFEWSAFLWMVAIFALEHHTRLAAGAMAGACYGLLAIRHGLASAIIAHVTTNFLLGLYVIRFNEWLFW